MAFSIYQFSVKPFSTRSKNKTENVNEITVFTVSIMMALYTDFVSKLEARVFYGWFNIALVLLNIAYNWGLVMVQVLKRMLRPLRIRIIHRQLRRERH